MANSSRKRIYGLLTWGLAGSLVLLSIPVLLTSRLLQDYLIGGGLLLGGLVIAADRFPPGQRGTNEERRYRTLFEQSPDGILVCSPDFKVLDANPAFCQMLGYGVEELRSMDYADLLDPADRPGYQQFKERTMRALPAALASERRMLAKDRSLREVELSRREMPDGNVQLTFRDITERRAAEEETRRLAAAIQQSDDLMVITDARGLITYINPGFERATGYAADEAIGRSTKELLSSGLHDADFYAGLDAAIAEGSSWSGKIVSRRKDGSLFDLELRVTPLHDEHGDRIGGVEVSHDISREVALEAQLRQAAKMEAIGHLAGGVAHDFNNILTAIRGYAELARQELPGEVDQGLEDVDEIIRASDRATRLVSQLLTFARRTVLEPQVLDPGETIREIAPMVTRLLGEHIQLEIEASSHEARIRVDPAQLEQVLLNLAVNSRDAMVDGGRLGIAVERVSLAETDVEAGSDARPGEFVRLAISDTGQGMNDEVKQRIFEPFFTTKEAGRGTGMGLAMVLGIVKMSEGWIEVDSTPGKGTTFSLYFPEVVADASSVDSAGQLTASPGGSETVLLVEDADSVRAFGRRCLTDLGYSVLEAANAGDAIALASAHTGLIELLVSDVVMPGMQGPELAQRIAELRPNIKVLYVSGYTQHPAIVHGDRASGYLAKPYTRDSLAIAVRKVLDAADG